MLILNFHSHCTVPHSGTCGFKKTLHLCLNKIYSERYVYMYYNHGMHKILIWQKNAYTMYNNKWNTCTLIWSLSFYKSMITFISHIHTNIPMVIAFKILQKHQISSWLHYVDSVPPPQPMNLQPQLFMKHGTCFLKILNNARKSEKRIFP